MSAEPPRELTAPAAFLAVRGSLRMAPAFDEWPLLALARASLTPVCRQPRLREVFQSIYSVTTGSGNNGKFRA